MVSAKPAVGMTIQRAIKRLPGKSSGWFRKGHRDKINELVDAYNMREISLAGSKRTIEGYRSLLPDIQKIWQAANAWHLDVMKGSPEKAQAIRDWMAEEVEREEEAKNAQLGELAEAQSLKAASDGAAFNALYATPDFTTASTAAVRWLNTPAIAPIYRYFLIQVQYEAPSLYAYEDIKKYGLNPTRAEAIRIYDKYDMGTAKQLNITGEGPKVGGIAAINAFREQITALKADDSAAPPANFGPVETSVTNVINEMFIAFRMSAPYKKVTTPP